MAALLILAALAGVVANSLAGPSRRLGRTAFAQPPTPTPPLPSPAPVEPAPALATPRPSLPKAAPAIRFEWNPGQPVREIDLPEAAEAFRQGFPFLDARRSADYRLGHIRGAHGISVWESDLDEKLTRFDATGHPLKSPIVIYCNGGDCQDSGLLAARLTGLGYRHLLLYRGGYPEWISKGRPIVQGEQP